MRRSISYAVAAGLAATMLVAGASAAQAAAFPVDPGPRVAGKPITGSGQNLPPVANETYNVGPYMAPQVEAYYTGKAIKRDRADVALAAWRWVRDWVRANCGSTPEAVRACRATVVFDVDETLLNSYTYSIAQDPQFTFNPTTWNEYVAACDYSGIPQTRDLYNKFIKLGVFVALVSAGSKDNKPFMVKCLREHGIAAWDRYIMRGEKGENLSDGEWKATERKGLERKGHRIVASIGDQVSDMSFGYLMHGFLLPNTMYYLH